MLCTSRLDEEKSRSYEDDAINNALAIILQDHKKPFTLVYTWRVVRNQPKWLAKYGASSSKRTKTLVVGDHTSSSQLDMATNCEFDLTSSLLKHPMGTKMAKRKARGKSIQTSSNPTKIKATEESLSQALHK